MSKKTRKLVKNYIEYTTKKSGDVVRIYAIPPQILSGLMIETPKPAKPTIEMKTKTGYQSRPIKEGDEGWDEWQKALEEWEEEQSQLEDAVTMVLALRDCPVNGSTLLEIEASELTFPRYMKLLADRGQFSFPTNEFMLKHLWLQEHVIGQHDEIEIGWELRKLGGEPEDLIEQMKASFRDKIYGQITESVGNFVTENSNGTKELDDQQSLLEAI